MKYFQLLTRSHSTCLVYKFINLQKQRNGTLLLKFLIFIYFYSFGTGCVQTVAIIGPIFGFLLGSLCAKLYVDIGFVNLGKGMNVLLFVHLFYCNFIMDGVENSN